jgi:hypothetical protein
MKTVQRKCGICAQARPFQKEKINHILHLLLSVFTLGFWAPIWLALIFINLLSPYRCNTCGSAKTF